MYTRVLGFGFGGLDSFESGFGSFLESWVEHSWQSLVAIQIFQVAEAEILFVSYEEIFLNLIRLPEKFEFSFVQF